MKLKTVELHNGTIAYQDEGKGKPIVLLHGFCGSSRYWDKVIPKLSNNFRLIAPDLPGHGGSSVTGHISSIEDMANHIKDFLDSLNVQEVTMFGHSMGGYITLEFAKKYSDRLNGFSLIHSTAFPDTEEAKAAREANIAKVEQVGVHPLIEGLVPKLFAQENQDKNADEVIKTKEIGYLTSPIGATTALKAMKDRPDLNNVLEATSLPVLLIAGEKDQVIPPEKTFSVTKSNILQSLITNSGHMSMFEAPGKLISEMEEFLKEI
ncbi:alpha/beta hydrolase [Peribacillus saganii]|uniref:Alpha/beta hydrolase n=1 Tax=Peribacillus saganii TaxID=2303992 RepID=A0A372LQQ3_9BACI|nr:alpha/beta hydrolase [Peribacillus saganii]RFU69857.1 alpha/beta hydrolase [Peribacillus saganii]